MFPSKRLSVPPKKTQMWTVAIELIGLLIISYPLIHIYLFTGGKWPNKRGFFCDDESLKHPLLEEDTISTGACFIIWAIISIVVVVSVEVLHFLVFQPDLQRANQDNMFKVPFVVLELFRLVGFFVIGTVTNLLITEIAKFSIGRLRPHFLTILVDKCGFELNDAKCMNNGYQKFVEPDYEQEFKNCKGNV